MSSQAKRLERLNAGGIGECYEADVGNRLDTLRASRSEIPTAHADLHDAGLVARREEDAWRYYDATDRAVAPLTPLDGTRGRER